MAVLREKPGNVGGKVPVAEMDGFDSPINMRFTAHRSSRPAHRSSNALGERGTPCNAFAPVNVG